jgi:hypothetical protein
MRFWAILVGFVATFLRWLLAHLSAADMRTPTNVGATRTPVLIELFTSESCSSCPPEFSIRQSDYAHHFRLDGPYTPQMVVDGDTELVGSDERRAIQVIEGAAKVAKLPISLSSLRLEGVNSLVLHVETGPRPSSTRPTPGQVLIALANDSDQSSVRGGENAGRVLNT